MKVKEVIDRIKIVLTKRRDRVEDIITDDLIYNKILSSRSLLISRKLNKKQKISDWVYQTIDDIELIPSTMFQNPYLNEREEDFYMSVYEIPSLILGMDKHQLKNVSSKDYSISYSPISIDNLKYVKHQKYTYLKPKYFIKNNRIYITQTKNIPKLITITGLFHDFIKADKMTYFIKEENIDIDNNLPPEVKNKSFQGYLKRLAKPYSDYDLLIDDSMIDTLVQLCLAEISLSPINTEVDIQQEQAIQEENGT